MPLGVSYLQQFVVFFPPNFSQRKLFRFSRLSFSQGRNRDCLEASWRKCSYQSLAQAQFSGLLSDGGQW